MAYIGKQPIVGNFVKLDAITTSATATYNLLNGGVAYFPQTANNCIVSLNGVIQSPTSAYTISGSTIVFSDALTASDSIDFILVLGDVLNIGTPSDGTITSAKLASGTDGLFAWQSVKTANFTAVKGEAYPCNTTSSSIIVTLPATPSAGDQVQVVDYAGTFDSNILEINPNGEDIEGSANNLALTGEREGVILTYIDSTQGWIATSGINEGTDALSTVFSADYLVVAGGGGGGTAQTGINLGGGGGAGGYLEGTTNLAIANNYTVTVGAGGAASTQGGTSSIGSVISSTGGGRGANNVTDAGNGGSGGGGGGISRITAGSGISGQGNNGGAGSSASPGLAGGGGGGASAVGDNATSTTAGNGGAGTASSITGSSVTRAGGGGGGLFGAGTGGTGGAGGGGAGGANAGAGSAGTVNTGGGGGGSSQLGTTVTGGAGGSGIVIIKYSDTLTITNPGGGLTSSTSTAGGFKVTSFTAGTGTIQFN
jgi:hypothetical protein